MAEDEVIDIVDIMNILMLETEIIVVEEECSFMLIPEDLPMVMVVITLAEDIHHKCQFIRHYHTTNLSSISLILNLLMNLVTMLLFAKFAINLVILLMHVAISILNTIYLYISIGILLMRVGIGIPKTIYLCINIGILLMHVGIGNGSKVFW